MRMKRLLLLMLAFALTLMLCACQTEKPERQPQQNGEATQLPAQGEEGEGNKVDFGLQTPPDPDFDSPDTSEGEKLYTIIGDYAYELDPATLQPIGPPLDPITHEPVENPVLDGQNPSSPNNPQYNQQPENNNQNQQPENNNQNQQPENNNNNGNQSGQDQGGNQQPTEDTKLPNTGMFLEDD